MTDEDGRGQWARRTFGRVDVGDERRVRRVVEIAARVASRPAGTITEVFDDSAEREAAYRLLSNQAVTSEALGAAVFTATAKQCALKSRVYVATDGSSLTMTDRKHARDVGSVGRRESGSRGLHVLSSLAIDASGLVLGICAQTWWARVGRPSKRRNDFRPLDEKETRYLAQTVRAAQSTLRAADVGEIVHVMDRGFDVASVLMLACDSEVPCRFIVRAAQDRRVQTPKGATQRYLRQAVRGTPILGRYDVSVPARGAQAARTARVQVQATAVNVLLPITRKRRHTLALNVVWVRELDGPKGASLSWLLLTTESVSSYEDVTEVVRGYSYRWRIEEMHRVWKSGGCNVEDMQLRSRESILKWATIHVAVAARALHLAHRARSEPTVAATEEFTQLEIDAAIVLRRKRTKLRFGEVPTLQAMVRLIADAGGYTGKSSGGPPGPTVIARGLERLAIATDVLATLRKSDE